MKRRIYQFPRLLVAVAVTWPALAWATAPSRPFDSWSRGLNQSHLTDDHRQSAVREIELPQGDPLSTPLVFSPSERRLFVDAEDGQLDEHSLIEAALIAGGLDHPQDLARYRSRFDALCSELRRQITAETTVLNRIETIHRLLHQRVLRFYEADATNLAAAFDQGIYNCASGTLLLIALADNLGLEMQAIELPGHVRAVATDGAERWEVEITSPVWNEAIRRLDDVYNVNKPQRHGDAERAIDSLEIANSSLTRSPLHPFTPSSSSTQRREVSRIGLIAMTYYNQGIDAFHTQRFAEAIAANRKALLLDPANREARGNLLASVNNWALALCNTGELQAAEELLAAGQKYDAAHQAFTHNAAYVQRLQMQYERSGRADP
jgi:tetratricopeptide (TPR) repeat protein